MFKKKFLMALSLCLALGIAMAGCGNEEAPEAEVPAEPSQEVSQSEEVKPEEPAPESSQEAEPEEIKLYIGMGEGNFKEYPANIEGDVTPDKLIAAISDLTGWDLTLADEVTTGKGGMTVSFSKESALFVGPPMEQKEEFFVYDGETLCQTILESIQETLRKYYVGPEGDPKSLDIYYCMEGDQPLYIPNTGMTFPMDEPYSWDKMTIKQ